MESPDPRCYPRRNAAASLKLIALVQINKSRASYPRRNAAASLKPAYSEAVTPPVVGYPRRNAAASLKRRCSSIWALRAALLSAA